MELGKILEENQQRFYRNVVAKASDNGSIELPEIIKNLITGSDYWKNAKQNRYKKLIREGNLAELLELAEIAQTKKAPANWFAKVASKAQWERTLDFLARLRKVAQDAAEVAKRLSVPPCDMKAVYAACWRLGSGVIRHAVTASELGRDPYRYFNWLVSRT